MASLLQLLFIVSLLVITMGARIRRSEPFSINFKNNYSTEYQALKSAVFKNVHGKPIDLISDKQATSVRSKNDGPTPCTINDREGICVHESACDEEHRIWEGGVVDEFDFRLAKQCPFGYWCCSNGTIPDIHTTDRLTTDTHTTDRTTTEGHTTVKTKTEDNNSNCLAPKTDVCPWCVLLYHSSSGDQNAQHPFCLGALVGSKAIITASTCLIIAKNKSLYAQLPNSPYPGKNYTILERMSHPNYNTGTHKHDIGLLVMESDVTLQEAQGVCLDFVRPLEGVCVGYGFDVNWKMYSTILQVTGRSCGKAGNSTDAACGTNEDAVCLVEIGGPILCPADPKGGLVLRGIARGICKADKVTLGSIAPSDRWIEHELASMDIPRDSYIFNKMQG